MTLPELLSGGLRALEEHGGQGEESPGIFLSLVSDQDLLSKTPLEIAGPDANGFQPQRH